MEHLNEFLIRHISDCVKNAFTEKNQSVEILQLDDANNLIVLDAPEYDFMWHRVSVQLRINTLMPLGGVVSLIWPAGTYDKSKIEPFEFGPHHSFGDALEKLQNAIWKRINED